MEKDEIQEMFLANAALKQMSLVDPIRKSLETRFEQLSNRYAVECLDIEAPVEQPKLDIQQAFDILVKTCQSATALELEHHPKGITDEQITALATARKMALDFIVQEISQTS